MKVSEIRQSFLDYFAERGHTIVESAPVVPNDDPTLLFTNAGMNQFKDVFLGTGARSYSRAADSQKCIRAGGKHNDLDEVGKDGYHQTLFEMLGNWSFGDYFKDDAITWAWDLLTNVWGMDKTKLYATVHSNEDLGVDDAREVWTKVTDINPEHVLVFGDKDNFWEMGDTGPCGPCTEIHIDRGDGACDQPNVPGHVCGVNLDCARYIELWNLVFIQYERKPDKSLVPLPAKHVDTGMGLERVCQVLQGVYSNYDTDLFTALIAKIAERSGVPYDQGAKGIAHRAIADHVRALSFSIADGADPGNTGRNYVLRRILRRASRFFSELGVNEPAIVDLVPTLVEVMGAAFPELKASQAHIERIIRSEEELFLRTLIRGKGEFVKVKDRLQAEKTKVFPGSAIFTLYDTHGFPSDLTEQMAEEVGLSADMREFERLLEEAKERSRKASKFSVDMGKYKSAPLTVFTGYDGTAGAGVIAAAGPNELVLDTTPFYAESGGQVGDTGFITGPEGEFTFEVHDTKKAGQVFVHVGEWVKGSPDSVKTGTPAQASVDAARRSAIQRNHTATHLLHWALHKVLDGSATQKGSEVSPSRLRFDFAWGKQVDAEELKEVERLVNEKIAGNQPLVIAEMPIAQARQLGAIAMFSEKYGERVRVIDIDSYSVELCGGTHVARTGDIGVFKIMQEASVSEGVRRVSALTGDAAVTLAYEESHLLGQIARGLKAKPEEVIERIEKMQNEIKELARKVKEARAASLPSWADLRSQAETKGDVKFLALEIDGADADALRRYGDQAKSETDAFVAFFFAKDEKGKVPMVTAISKPLVDREWHARDLLRPVVGVLGGGGGGKRADMCMGSGKDASKIPEALAEAARQVSSKL